jgi:hypothetical protein
MCEPLEAVPALERLLARVAAHVLLEVLRTGESTAALGTAVWPFAGVVAFVQLEVVRRAADLVAGRAAEQLLGGVHDLHVPLQVRQPDELPDALVAFVRSLAGVRPRVGAQMPGLRELPGAHGARVRLLAGVIAHVTDDVSRRGELLEALVALVRFYAVVFAHVRPETARLHEPLGARWTFIRFLARVMSLVSLQAALPRKRRWTSFATVPRRAFRRFHVDV